MELRRFNLILEPLGPVHIGSGEILLKDWDFVVHSNQGRPAGVRVIDIDRALEGMSDAEAAAISNGRIAAALSQEAARAATRYTTTVTALPGGGEIRQVRQFMRDPQGRPYIPGSSLKGALRTALLVGLLDAIDPRQRAADMERRAFSFTSEQTASFPNRDMNRALRVSDLTAESVIDGVLDVRTHRTAPAPGKTDDNTIPTWCEVVLPGCRFQGMATIETSGAWWGRMTVDQQAALQDPARLVRAWAGMVLDFEDERWGNRRPPATQTFHANLRSRLERGQTLAVLGWGTGWHSKTVGARLSPEQVGVLAQTRGLARRPGAGFPATFPVTRKLAATHEGPVPMGWVRLSMTPADV